MSGLVVIIAREFLFLAVFRDLVGWLVIEAPSGKDASGGMFCFDS